MSHSCGPHRWLLDLAPWSSFLCSRHVMRYVCLSSVLYLSGTWSFVGKNCFLPGEKTISNFQPKSTSGVFRRLHWETWETTKCPPRRCSPSIKWLGLGQVTMPKLLVSVCGIPPDEASSCCFKRQANMPVRTQKKTGHPWRTRAGGLQTRKTHTSTQASHSCVSS